MNIPRSIHGVIDYVSAGVLLVAPWLFQFPDGPTAGVARVFGVVALLYSLGTDYELALLRVLPFPFHRALDLLWGLGLLFSPIHFAINGGAAVLFVALGLIAVVAAFLTRGRFSPTGSDQSVAPGVK
ncbi:MAG: hypothetical protein WCF18_09485 [Chthoniobacteraceae bacterium]